ncbi:hypothetical protein AE06_02583 [Klebsiella variicola]|nr:hypothetical protein AE06_02583 [Klebsiella variicola]
MTAGGWAHQEMLCLLPADPAGFFLPPQGHPFFQQGKRRRTGTKVTAGGWAHQEMLSLLPADPAGLFLPPQRHPFFQQGKRRRTGTKVTAGGWAHQENWRERRRASRTGRQDGGQRAVETRMSSPPVPPDEAGVERTAQRQFSAPCWGSWGAGETPPMPFTRRGRNEIVRKVGERNIPPYRPFPSFANMRQNCRGKSSYQRDKSCLPPV